jgi:hypothetical protein
MHFGRPLGTLFDQIGQFPEQVGAAQRMSALPKAEIRLPAIMHSPVLKIFEQRILTYQGLSAAFFVDEQIGKTRRRGDMEPMENSFPPHAVSSK